MLPEPRRVCRRLICLSYAARSESFQSGVAVGVLSQIFSLFQYRFESAICLSKKSTGKVPLMSIDFKGSHYPKDVILYAVFFYIRYGVSYRDLEEIMADRGVEVDHATLNRWVVKFSPSIAANAQARKMPTAGIVKLTAPLRGCGQSG